MKLIDEIKTWLLDNVETDWYGDYSDGGYYFKITTNGDERIECEFNGATCYGITKVNEYTVKFGVEVISDEHVLVWFHSQVGHGSTHITDIDSFKWYIDKIL